MLRNVLALLLVLGFSSPAVASPEVGNVAPAISAQDINGKAVSLADFKGKTVVLEWNNFECPFVKKFYSAGKMQELQKAATADSVVWLTINSGAHGKQGNITPEEAKKLTAEKNWSGSHYILDPKGEIGRSYGAKTTPNMFVVNKDGVLAYAGAIDDKDSTNPADIAGAKNFVTAALANLKEGKPVETTTTRAYGCGVKYAD